MTVSLQRLDINHATLFLEAVATSAKLHDHWVSPPSTPDDFQRFEEKYRGDRNVSYVALNNSADLVGCINLNEIVRGPLQSAFLGYYAFVPYEGKGFMKQALRLVLAEAFTAHGLHRLEANIQPNNERSKNLARSLGFRREGFSPRYLKLNGEWCDHERFAITVEEWNAVRAAT